MIKDTLTYDIVGSFLRPAEIKEARKAYKDGKITKEELTQAEDLAIASLVEKEVAHGLKYVTDGEFRRRWWHLDWLKEFDGFDTIHFTKEINGTINEIELGTITGKVFYNKEKEQLQHAKLTHHFRQLLQQKQLKTEKGGEANGRISLLFGD